MYSKVTILVWERWRRTRWAVMAACLLTLTEQLMLGFGFIAPGRAISIGGTGTAILLFVLLGGQCELRSLDLRFPPRLLRLPIRTTTLLAIHLGYGVVVLALPVLIRIGFAILFSGSTSVRQAGVSSLWNALLLLETVYMALQTLSWLGGVKAYVLCLAPSLVFLFALPFVADRFNLILNTNDMCWIIISLCAIISLLNVSADRHGAWTKGRRWTVKFSGIYRRKPPRPFSSALQAQIWYESRQTGYLFPVSVLCIIGILLVAALFMESTSPVLSLFTVALSATIVLAEITGFLAFGVYHRDHASNASGFWLRRPVDTRALAHARLRSMMRSITRVLVILTVFALVLAVRDGAFGILDVTRLLPGKWTPVFSSSLGVVAAMASALCCLAVICWVLLRMPLLMIFLSQVYWGGVNVARTWNWEAMFIFLNGLIFLGVLIAFYVAKRRTLISKATLVCSVCLFAAVVTALWGIPLWLGSKGLPGLNQIRSIFLISFAALPFIPVAVAPLMMERLRHRHGVFQYLCL